MCGSQHPAHPPQFNLPERERERKCAFTQEVLRDADKSISLLVAAIAVGGKRAASTSARPNTTWWTKQPGDGFRVVALRCRVFSLFDRTAPHEMRRLNFLLLKLRLCSRSLTFLQWAPLWSIHSTVAVRHALFRKTLWILSSIAQQSRKTLVFYSTADLFTRLVHEREPIALGLKPRSDGSTGRKGDCL